MKTKEIIEDNLFISRSVFERSKYDPIIIQKTDDSIYEMDRSEKCNDVKDKE